MQRRLPGIADHQRRRLKIKDIPVTRSGNRRPLDGIPSQHLPDHGQQHTPPSRFLYDDDIEQPVHQACFWSDGNMIAELIPVRNVDEESLHGEGRPGPAVPRWQLNEERLGLGPEEIPHRHPYISLQTPLGLKRKFMGHLSIEPDTA
jgi:hypothetical protein